MNRLIRIISLLCLFLLCFVACEYKGPEAVWKPDPVGDIDPVITGIDPANEAVAGIAKIKIVGENFSPNLEENQVFFGNVKVDIYSGSETELSVYRPNLIAENIIIRVVVREALKEAQSLPYVVSATGRKINELRDLGTLNTMVVDQNESIYIHSNRKTLFKISETGEFVEVMQTLPRVVFDMKMGPEGLIYVGRDEKYLMVARPGGTDFEKWAAGLPDKVKYIDFDENKNLYAGGKRSGIILIKPDETFVKLGGYENHDIIGVRVYNGELYVAAIYMGEDGLDLPFGIYKHTINSDGTLGEKVVFVDWAQTGNFAETTFSEFEFDEDGILMVSTDGGPGFNLDPMMMVYPDGTVDTFYKGGLLTGPILGMAWGENETLYYYKPNDLVFTIHEMGMAKRCAPRYGRES